MNIRNRPNTPDDESNITTVIAAGSKHVGKFSGAGNYVVYGEVEGDCDIQGRLTLENNAIWKGTIQAEELIIAGCAEGDVIANSRIRVDDTAEVKGNLTGAIIQVAEGASIQGGINVRKDSNERDNFSEKNQHIYNQESGRTEVLEFSEKRQPEQF